MVSPLYEHTVRQFNAIRGLLATLDSVRAFVSTHSESTDPVLAREALTFQNVLPSRASLSIITHCFVVTHTYAVYESFVSDAIAEYLANVRRRYTYRQLDKVLRRAHLVGLGRVIDRINSGRYRHLNWENLLTDFYRAVVRRGDGQIAPEAFLDKQANLRFGELDRLLRKCALSELNTWISTYPPLRAYVTSRGGLDVSKELANFIEFRNEASHETRRASTPLGIQSLLDIVDLMQRICAVIAEYIDHTIANIIRSEQRSASFAQVIHMYGRISVVDVQAQNMTLSVGDDIYALGARRCYPTRILGIHTAPGVAATSVAVTAPQLLGLQVSVMPQTGSLLLHVV